MKLCHGPSFTPYYLSVNNMHRKCTAIWLVESFFKNPKQCNYRSKQFNYIVIALVVKKQNGGRVCSGTLRHGSTLRNMPKTYRTYRIELLKLSTWDLAGYIFIEQKICHDVYWPSRGGGANDAQWCAKW